MGLGFQEILLILFLFVLFVCVPVVLILVIIRNSRKKAVLTTTPILENANRLRTLKSLLDQGVISRDEYESERKKLLGS